MFTAIYSRTGHKPPSRLTLTRHQHQCVTNSCDFARVHILRAQVEVGKARLPHRQSLPQQGHRQSVVAPAAGAYRKAASAWELSEPDVWDRCERTCCVSVPMPQETTPWSDADSTGACLSVSADAQSLWSSLDDTSFRRSAASESSRPEGFISGMEAAEDAGMWAETLGLSDRLG